MATVFEDGGEVAQIPSFRKDFRSKMLGSWKLSKALGKVGIGKGDIGVFVLENISGLEFMRAEQEKYFTDGGYEFFEHLLRRRGFTLCSRRRVQKHLLWDGQTCVLTMNPRAILR